MEVDYKEINEDYFQTKYDYFMDNSLSNISKCEEWDRVTVIGKIIDVVENETFGGYTLSLVDECNSNFCAVLIKKNNFNFIFGIGREIEVNGVLSYVDDNCSTIIADKILLIDGLKKELDKIMKDKKIIEKEKLRIEKKQSDLYDVEYMKKIRGSVEYREWVNNTLDKCDSACIICGEKRKPHTHHIFSFKNHPEYRLNYDNGVVLCRWCHRKYHDIHGKGTANPTTFVEFMREEYRSCQKRKL